VKTLEKCRVWGKGQEREIEGFRAIKVKYIYR
jgi:hypothetical protein